MADKTGVLNPELVMFLIENQGLSQSEIGRRFGVTRAYVNQLAKQGGYRNPFKDIDPHMPWPIRAADANRTTYLTIRNHGHYMLHGIALLTFTDARKLTALYRKLETYDVVIDYICDADGKYKFVFTHRTPKDEDFIFKIRKGVNLTDKGREIWRLPADWETLVERQKEYEATHPKRNPGAAPPKKS